MGRVGGVFRNVLVWSYERGTIQYDIICGLILAFIFFVPRSCFVKPKPDLKTPALQSTVAPQSRPAGQQAETQTEQR